MGKVTVKQSIPKQQWFLFPSPKVELKGHLLPDDHSKRLSDRFVASYDFYRSQGTLRSIDPGRKTFLRVEMSKAVWVAGLLSA